MTVFREIARLSAGTSVAQAINAISIPILAWIYDPAVLGLFLVIDAYCDVLGLGSPLAVDKALHVSRSVRRDRALLTIASASVLGVATLGAIGSFGWIVSGGHQVWIACAIFLLIGLRGAFYVGQSMLMKAGKFDRIAKAEIVRSGSNLAGRIGFGLFGFGVVGLIASTILAVISALRLMRIRPGIPRAPRRRYAIGLLARYRGFLLWEGGAQFLRQMPLRAPVVVVALLFALDEAAFFAVALLLIYRPAEIVVRAVAEVTRATVDARLRMGAGDAQFTRNAILSVWLLAPPAILAIAGIVALTERLVLPIQWHGLGAMCMALSPFGIALMLARPLQTLFSVFQQQRAGFMLDCGLAICAVAGPVIGGQSGIDLKTSAALSGCVMLVISAAFTTVMMKRLQYSYGRADGGFEI